MPTWLEGSSGDAIATDDTYFPILVATFVGAPTEETIRPYFAWLDRMLARAARERVPLVNVTDSGLSGVPSAQARRLIADLTKAWEQSGAGPRVPVTSYVVVENTAIRGALRVLGWLHGDLRAVNVATAKEALDHALEDLARAKVAAPPGLNPSRWQRPARPKRNVGLERFRGSRSTPEKAL